MAAFFHCLSILHVISLANALAFPSPTSHLDGIDSLGQGWTPKPTQAPLDKRFGAISDRALFARQNDNSNTCAWFDQNPSESFTCASGFACAYDTAVNPYWWSCCSTDSSGQFISSLCNPYTSCVDNAFNANTYSGPLINSEVLYCGTALPACATFVNANSYGVSYTNLFCDTASAYAHAYMFTRAGASSVVPASSSIPTSFPPLNAHPSSTSIPLTNTSKKNPASTRSTSTGTHTSKSTNKPGTSSVSAGAIAGGVVGGVVVIALLGGIGFLMWRKKRTREHALPEISQLGDGQR